MMTPQLNKRTGDDGKGPHSWATDVVEPFITPAADTLAEFSIEVVPGTISRSRSTTSGSGSSISYPPYTERPSWSPTFLHRPPPGLWSMSTSTSSTLSNVLPLWETQAWKSSQITTSYMPLATQYATPTATSDKYDSPRPDSIQSKGASHGPGLYAAAAIVPIIVLAVIGAIVFFCLRKRRRQREEAAVTQMKAEEMKMHPRPQPSLIQQPYIAAPQLVLPPLYTLSHNSTPPSFNPGSAQPIILGPIPSGMNGAYFTGMDTSDVISMNSANSLRRAAPDPFVDNNSMSEPPPPYRPHSTAPPSFATSRHSSLRAPPISSQTHLIERSPFEDPTDDDAVSELSGPTRERDEDAMSAVSDLSYQNDPFVTMTSV